jgi:acetate---CoA ligase (ADP-forming)
MRAASAHTGAVAGDQRVFRALVEEAGGAWARDPHELLELARALAEPRARPRGDGGLAILTCSGGDSGMAADEAARVGAELPDLAPDTRERLGELLPAAATVGNPLDYTALIWGETELLGQIVGVVGADPGVDQLLCLYDHPQGLAPASEASWAAVRAGIVAGAAEADAATLVASTLPDLIDDRASGELAERGVPAIAGLRTALACAQALRAAPGDPERLRGIADAAAAARAFRAAGAGLGGDGRWLDEIEAKELVGSAGIPVPARREVAGEDESVTAGAELGWPVALKLASPELRHKSEAGALALDLGDEGELRDAYRRLVSSPAAAGARVLVERMAPSGAELLVAVRTDAVVPALVIGLGGIWTEALDEVAILPLPADPPRVERALRSLRGAPLITGGRGRRPLDLPAAARLAAAAGTLALDAGLDLLELNPVVVQRDGCLVLDAVAHRAE